MGRRCRSRALDKPHPNKTGDPLRGATSEIGHFSDIAALADDVRCRGDSVAKVVLQKVSKILRAAGAVFV
jgi:hypothetical protein